MTFLYSERVFSAMDSPVIRLPKKGGVSKMSFPNGCELVIFEMWPCVYKAETRKPDMKTQVSILDLTEESSEPSLAAREWLLKRSVSEEEFMMRFGHDQWIHVSELAELTEVRILNNILNDVVSTTFIYPAETTIPDERTSPTLEMKVVQTCVPMVNALGKSVSKEYVLRYEPVSRVIQWDSRIDVPVVVGWRECWIHNK